MRKLRKFHMRQDKRQQQIYNFFIHRNNFFILQLEYDSILHYAPTYMPFFFIPYSYGCFLLFCSSYLF